MAWMPMTLSNFESFLTAIGLPWEIQRALATVCLDYT